jgi:hypothetical protein
MALLEAKNPGPENGRSSLRFARICCACSGHSLLQVRASAKRLQKETSSHFPLNWEPSLWGRETPQERGSGDSRRASCLHQAVSMNDVGVGRWQQIDPRGVGSGMALLPAGRMPVVGILHAIRQTA